MKVTYGASCDLHSLFILEKKVKEVRVSRQPYLTPWCLRVQIVDFWFKFKGVPFKMFLSSSNLNNQKLIS